MKVGVVGCGFMGLTHLDAYANMPNVEVVGVVDTRPDAAAAAAELARATPYPSYDEFVAAEEPDLIDICLPTAYHRDLAVRVAREGRHVILEKPMTRLLEDADRIIEAFSNSQGRLFVAHVVRFFPEYVQLKGMIDAGRFGEVGVVRTSRKSPFLGGWNDWYANWQASGGLVVDMLVHDFDFLRWSFGEVERVYAKSLLGREYNRVDYALVTLRFRNNVIAHVEGHWGYPDPFWYSIEVAGTKALASVDSRKYAPARILVNERTRASGNGESPGSSLGLNPYQLELEHFVRCVETGEEPVVSEVDGYEALRISLAAMESAVSRVPISLRGS